jgi:hypothetical protein
MSDEKLVATEGGLCVNTDVHLWPQTSKDYYAPRVFGVTDDAIGIDVGGMVYVKTMREWHRLAEQDAALTASAVWREQWVSVKDRLPEPCQHVLMVFDSSYGWDYLIGWHEEPDKWYVNDQDNCEAFCIEYWMPLPPANMPPYSPPAIDSAMATSATSATSERGGG